MNRKKIFFFPYAGGSSFAFRNIAGRLKNEADEIVLDYPGHGTRFGEKMAEDIYTLALDMAEKVLENYFSGNEDGCIFLGHSMGALVAYETAIIIEDKIPLEKLILCGSLPPGWEKENFSVMNKDQAFEKIYSMGFIPEEVKNEPELYDVFSEIIYADVKVLSSLKYQGEHTKVKVPVYIFSGKDDRECEYDLLCRWEDYTYGGCVIKIVPGTHFFPFEDTEAFSEQIAQLLKEDPSLNIQDHVDLLRIYS